MLNIVVLTNMDISAHYALGLLLPNIEQHRVHIFKSSKVGGTSVLPNELMALGQHESELLQSSDFKNSPLHSATLLDNINTPEGFEQVSTLKPDIILSIRFGRILKDAIIQLPRFGVLNLHSGLLPDYKGVMATFWAMLNAGDNLVGATIHTIDDASIDTGNIISRIPIELDGSKSYWWNVLNVYKYSVPELVNAVKNIEAGRQLNRTPQSEEGGYFSYPSEQNILAFHKKGFKLFEPSDFIDFLN